MRLHAPARDARVTCQRRDGSDPIDARGVESRRAGGRQMHRRGAFAAAQHGDFGGNREAPAGRADPNHVYLCLFVCLYARRRRRPFPWSPPLARCDASTRPGQRLGCRVFGGDGAVGMVILPCRPPAGGSGSELYSLKNNPKRRGKLNWLPRRGDAARQRCSEFAYLFRSLI